MNLIKLEERFRSEVNDEDVPYLWESAEVLDYMIDAQDEFVRLIGGILDSTTTAITDVALTAANPWATYNPLILRMRDAYTVTAGKEVQILNYADIRAGRIGTPDYGRVAPLTMTDLTQGDVNFVVFGLDEKQMRVFRVPAVSDTLRFRQVYRLPYPRIVDNESALEIADQHHVWLLKWMKHRAYSKQDSEARDDKKAEQNRLEFVAYCERAKAERERRHFRPRIVQYGGI